METHKATHRFSTFTLISLVLFLQTQSSSAQIGLDWNKLRGEDTSGLQNQTADAGQIDFQSTLFEILKGLQDATGGEGEGGGWLPPFDEDTNGTLIPEDEDKEPSKFPPGFENLQYVKESCWNQTMQLFVDFQAQKRYAKQMVHTSGSIIPDPSAEFTGYPADLGLYLECLAVTEKNDDPPFDAQYCVMSTYMEGFEGGWHSGLCVPAECEVSDLEVLLHTIKNVLEVQEGFTFFSCESDIIPYKGADIFVILLLVILGTLVLFGTMYDIYDSHSDAMKRGSGGNKYEKTTEENGVKEAGAATNENIGENEDEEGATEAEEKEADVETEPMNIQEGDEAPATKKSNGTFGKVLLCFSAIHNFNKIFDTSKQPGNLGALNGLRVISMFWIILGHTWQFVGTYKASSPIYLYTELLPKFWAQTILNGVFAVDTFFLLSGLLLAYLTLKALKKSNGKMRWGLFYFHRFYRITPLYMLLIGVWSTLPIHLVSGPGASSFFRGSTQQCKDYWWANLFYFNNLYPFPGNLGAMCMGWSWYLANDMQFFIISPIILILLYKKRKIGFAVIGGLFPVSYFSTLGISYYYGLTVGVNQKPFNNNTADHPTADHLYAKPYHRIQPYLVGLIIGYMLWKLEGKKFNIPKIVVVGCWIAAAGTALATVYGLYNTAHGYIIPQGTTVFYYVVNATAWGLAVGWVAFACIKGYGGPVNTILSWPVWTPLARITFGAYLVHPMLQFIYVWSLPTAIPATTSVMTFHTIAFIFMAYAVSLLFSLLIEAPLMGLEKLMFKR